MRPHSCAQREKDMTVTTVNEGGMTARLLHRPYEDSDFVSENFLEFQQYRALQGSETDKRHFSKIAEKTYETNLSRTQDEEEVLSILDSQQDLQKKLKPINTPVIIFQPSMKR